ncbi:hypothetical protein EIP91_002770 [Steccherinum ochraceum]|uniref:RING-type domain-containing protein n=1 Tax=Steccherinum ochraceum TaxID=92696 RepID=A0A4R0RD97_9APHY|nr:hypothetical protein EIP91_002770 [Steccherinum ochraceum]
MASSFLRTILGLSLNIWFSIWIVALCIISPAFAYIPASPINGSVAPPDASGTNGSDASYLNLQWFGGGYQERISYQLVGADSNGVSKGALVHFSEDHLTNDNTTTPWIALVSCDANATDASDIDDIFTLASDRGAVAALLYSLYSDRCVINPEYADPANFDQLMDIFSTPLLSSSQFIEYQYGAINATKYGHYDAKLLNESAAQINATIQNGTIDSKGFMFATLVAFNATGEADVPNPGTTTSSSSNNSGGSGNTSLAMIILYAITGCVSALFCIVIISGAIRAIRHPERYGPRDGDEFGAQFGQSRARGLTRAILDTFPVVKFGAGGGGAGPGPGPVGVGAGQRKDVESIGTESRASIESAERKDEMEMRALGSGAADAGKEDAGEVEAVEDVGVLPMHGGPGQRRTSQDNASASSQSRQSPITPSTQPEASSSQLPSPVTSPTPRPRRAPSQSTQPNGGDIVPDSIGRETCPICIVDFEEGDDLRVLPCEGKHRFHQECVDQWLLELSSSCPICRQDFHTLETMMTHDSMGDHLEPPTALHAHQYPRPLSGAGARLSRYLRLARRRRGENNQIQHQLASSSNTNLHTVPSHEDPGHLNVPASL